MKPSHVPQFPWGACKDGLKTQLQKEWVLFSMPGNRDAEEFHLAAVQQPVDKVDKQKHYDSGS